VGQGLFFPAVYSPSSKPSIGGGGQFFADYRPFQEVSFGLGLDYLFFSSPHSFKVSSADIGGRLYPFDFNQDGEFYLQGGVGMNVSPLATATQAGLHGHYHGNAGFGYRFCLDKTTSFDLGAQYDFYSPQGAPVQGARIKAGLTFGFGEVTEKLFKPELKREHALFIPLWKVTPVYTWKEGDTLREVAAKLYGDEDFYPLLVDANPTLLAPNVQFRTGMKLNVPVPPRYESGFEAIRIKAVREGAYVHLQNLSEGAANGWGEVWAGPSAYTWKKGDTLPSVARELYGDEDLYPLLVDANQKRLSHPVNLVPGVVIKVPKPEIDEIDDIHMEVWFDKDPYIWWKNVSIRQAQPYEKPVSSREGNSAPDIEP
jgi:LysM repeat protein